MSNNINNFCNVLKYPKMALDFVKANQKIFLIESLGHKHKKIKNNISKKIG